ncbi:MAG TPA: tRNA isopentenyl-2-thiomethyl-A-37 hydroxylase MiaE [Anaeromyxobacteraceae bacterium]|nr:tRNA isopentenyl-2-thiomethyl-A-37 hydroxylase MiaE [Anaeromyxobacteraceae bacterium]
MTILRRTTDPRWTEVALSDLDATLGDHAHCEKKAAATAVKLVADHPDRPDLVRKMAKLAQEETHHFLTILNELARRGRTLPPDGGDPYVQGLLRMVRGGPARLLDRLLVCALVEARSRERLALLAAALRDERLRDVYGRMAAAEAGHETLFVELARAEGGEAAVTRLAELAEAEAALVASLPLLPRIH